MLSALLKISGVLIIKLIYGKNSQKKLEGIGPVIPLILSGCTCFWFICLILLISFDFSADSIPGIVICTLYPAALIIWAIIVRRPPKPIPGTSVTIPEATKILYLHLWLNSDQFLSDTNRPPKVVTLVDLSTALYFCVAQYIQSYRAEQYVESSFLEICKKTVPEEKQTPGYIEYLNFRRKKLLAEFHRLQLSPNNQKDLQAAFLITSAYSEKDSFDFSRSPNVVDFPQFLVAVTASTQIAASSFPKRR